MKNRNFTKKESLFLMRLIGKYQEEICKPFDSDDLPFSTLLNFIHTLKEKVWDNTEN